MQLFENPTADHRLRLYNEAQMRALAESPNRKKNTKNGISSRAAFAIRGTWLDAASNTPQARI